MVDQTDHYGLSIIKAGDDLSADGYKFSDADRQRLDHLLWLGAEAHRHTGDAAGGGEAPVEGPELIVEVEGGTLPASTTYYYGFTLIDPTGQESGLSPTTSALTSPPVDSPEEPVAEVTTVGGDLRPGNYLYALSAWTEFDTLETVAGAYTFVSVPVGTATNVVTLTLPPLPAGATGFNVYRRAPGGQDLTWIATIDMSVVDPPDDLVDDGNLEEDCTRFAPTVDTSASASAITVTLPTDEFDDPFVLEDGWSWRLYRSLDADDFSNSLLALVDDGIVYLDVGDATTQSSPPGAGLVVGSPEKIDLTDGAEVQGRLPLSQMSGFPVSFEWSFPGPVVAMEATSPWVCEFPQFTILGIRPVLGRGYEPADFDVIVDVLLGSGVNPTYETVWADEDDRPIVPIGAQIGARVAPDVASSEMVEGDSLVFDVIQAGGLDPETQTDRDLVIKVYGIAYGYEATTSHPWAE